MPPRKSIALLLCMLFGFMMLASPSYLLSTKPNTNHNSEPTEFELSYTPHAPIACSSDFELDTVKSSGIGTEGDPIIIEGWNITLTGPNQEAIFIYTSGVTSYFVIRNCFIDGKGFDTTDGITLIDLPSNRCVIENVYIKDAEDGIYMRNSDSAYVQNATITNGERGIYLENCDYTDIVGCSITFNGRGIDLNDGDFCTITDTNCTDNIWFGAYLYYSTTVEINDCRFERTNWNKIYGDENNQGWGVYADHSSYMMLYNCTIADNSFGAVKGYTSGFADLTDNWVQRNGVGFLFLDSTNCIFRNNTITDNLSDAIHADSCPASIVDNNTIESNLYGVEISLCDSSRIENNTLIDDSFDIYADSIAGYDTYVVNNNYVNGLPLAFLIHEVDTTAPSNIGQLIMINCTRVNVSGLDCSNTTIGIKLDFCDFCTISDSIVNDVDAYGVYCRWTHNTKFENITCINSRNTGILLSNGNHLTVDESNISNCLNIGVYLLGTMFATVSYTTVTDCAYSYVGASDAHTIIANNTFIDGAYAAIGLYSYSNTTIVGNDFINNGIYVQGLMFNDYLNILGKISDNTVNGKPLGIYMHLSDLQISSPHGQIYLFNCTNIDITSQDCSDTADGIAVIYSSGCSVSNSVCQRNSQFGVRLSYADSSSISGVNCDNSAYISIWVEHSNYVDIVQNQALDAAIEIALTNSDYPLIEGNLVQRSGGNGIAVYASDHPVIVDNNCSNNEISGIKLSGCQSPIVQNNIVNLNAESGLHLNDVSASLVSDNICEQNELDGIYLHDSLSVSGNLITNNIVSDNQGYGILLLTTTNSHVAYNSIMDNLGYGLVANVCTDARIHHNFFINNNQGLTQGCDNGSTTSQWYNLQSAEGNLWSDYDLSGVYNIDGTTGAIDLYPLVGTDSDNDGLLDSWEIINGLDPFSSDSDGDSIPDDYEIANGLDPLVDDSGDDLDNDGLTNLQDFQYGLLANNSDTDSDTMPDGFEIDNGLNPLVDDSTLDPDEDDLSNVDEYELGLDVNDDDSDDDLILDGYEVANGLDPLTDDSTDDFDNDGLTNLEEFNLGTSSNNNDTDSDVMLDLWEVQHSLNPLFDDSGLDLDFDGLSNVAEFNEGTAPDDSDTDSDSLNDYWEVTYGLNPLVDDASGDLDNDNLTNLEEYILGLNPASVDSDGDLMPDNYEVENRLNPLFDDADLDYDGDGATNYEEYLAGTNPNVSLVGGSDLIGMVLAAAGGVAVGALIVILLTKKPWAKSEA